MKSNKDLLGSILKTSQMGQTGIRSVQKYAKSERMYKTLQSQLEEYASIERQAQRIADCRGWDMESLSPASRRMAGVMARSRLALKRSDSRAAAMMIQGNTKGMIKGLKNQHACINSDEQITALSNRLLQFEQENIRQMQRFV